MKLIKNFVDKIFKDVILTEELKLQKVELYDHLIDKVNDLINLGVLEEDAVSRVLSNMGTIDTVRTELNLTSNDKVNKTLNNINYFSFYSVFAAILGLEVYFLSVYFLENKLTGFLLMMLCLTLSILMMAFSLFQLDNNRDKFKDLHKNLITKTRRLNISSLIISVTTIAIILPFLGSQLNFFNYFKLSIFYLIIAYLAIIFGFDIIDKIYYQIIPINYKPDRIKLLLKNYFYVPFFTYLLCVLPGDNQQLFLILLLLSIPVLMIIKFRIFKLEKTWKSFNLFSIIFTFTLAILIYSEFVNNKLGLNSNPLPIYLTIYSLLIIYFLLIIINFIKSLKELTFNKFINNLFSLISNVIYLFVFLRIANTTRYENLTISINIFITQRMIIFYLISELLLNVLRRYLTKSHEPLIIKMPFNKVTLTKINVLTAITLIIILLFTFKIPQYFTYKNNLQSEYKNESVTNFKYQVYKAKNKDHFILLSYKLSDGRYCIGYQQYYQLIGPIRLPSSSNFQCDNNQIKQDTIAANHSVRMKRDSMTPSQNIILYVFGNNSLEYKEIIITYDWGETKIIPLNKNKLFFYYEEITAPDSFSMDNFWGNNFFKVEKVR